MELYHLMNRGVEGRNIFLDSQDYARFVHELYEFNDTRPADNLHRLFKPQMKDLVGLSFQRQREKLVDIHAWCLMKNHYHLLVSEHQEGGLSHFLMKLNVGYAKYFNKRYQRKGTLFQGRTKKVLIERDHQFNYIFHYIHLNPLDYFKGAENWRIRTNAHISNAPATLEYLKKYRWSSYLDYVGEKNFPSLLSREFFTDRSEYKKGLERFLRDADPTPNEKSLALLE